MIFNKLTLNNFKSYSNAEIRFDKGITVIVGENGAGKSTIFEAISFALFKEHAAGKLADLVRNNSNDKMSVELEFTAAGNVFKVIREKANSVKSTLLKKSKDNNLFIPMCVGEKEVANEIESILNLDKKLFLNAIYVRQGEIAQLVDKSPAEKKKLVGKLLGLDFLEKAWTDLAPQISAYENMKSEVKGYLTNEDEVKDRYDRKTEKADELRSRGKELEKKLEEIKKKKESIKLDLINKEREKKIHEKFVSDLQLQENNANLIKEQIKNIDEKLSEINEAKDKLENLRIYAAKIPMYEQFERNIEKIQNLRKEANMYNSQLESILTQEDILSKNEIDKIDYLNFSEELEQLKEEKVEIEKKLAVVKQLISENKELNGKISYLKNNVDTFLAKRKEELISEGVNSNRLSNANDIDKLIELIDQHINKIKETIDLANKKISSKKEAKAKQMHILEESQRNLDELLKNVGSYCPFCQSKIPPNRKIDLADLFKKQIKAAKKKIQLLESEIKELNQKKDKLNLKLTTFESISRNVLEFMQESKSLNVYLNKVKENEEKIRDSGVNDDVLGQIILKIQGVENKIESLQDAYDAYMNAIALLKVLPDKREIQEKLNEVNRQIIFVTESMQKAIDADPFLTIDINHEDLTTKINDLKAKETEYNQILGIIKDLDNIQAHRVELKQQLNMNLDKIESLKNNISECNYDEEKHMELKTTSEGFETEYNEVYAELHGIKEQGKEIKPELTELEKQLKFYKVKHQEHDNLSDYIHLLSVFRDLYSKNGIQRDLRNRSRPLIQKYTKNFFSQFNFDYSDLIMDEDYNITVFGPEGESTLDMVSGGEKIAIALSLRLGITQALSRGSSDTILLDEPTIFLDSARRHELINLIKEMTLLPQMIIVTHEPQLESAADNLIKVEKVNGISKIN